MGVAMGDRAARADEFLEVMKRAWTDDVVEFDGDFFQIPASVIDLKPVQKPHPPIYMAAFSPGAMKRVATFADGWTPVMWPTDQLSSAMDGIKTMAREAGRNPDDLELVVRGNVRVTPEPLEERGSFVGSWDQILSDIKATELAGQTSCSSNRRATPRRVHQSHGASSSGRRIAVAGAGSHRRQHHHRL